MTKDEEHLELFQRLGKIELILAEFRAESGMEHKRITKLVEKHDRDIHGHESYLGLKARVGQLEDHDKRRAGHLTMLWTAVVTSLGAWVASWFGK